MPFKPSGYTEFIAATIKILRKKNPEIQIDQAINNIHKEWTQLTSAQQRLWEQKAINKAK